MYCNYQLLLQCDDLLKSFGDWVEDFWGIYGSEHVHFDACDKDKILKTIADNGGKVQYEPGLEQFSSMY